MAKRDELEKEAKGEMGLFGALALGIGAAVVHSVSNNKKKDQLKLQIDQKLAEIKSVEAQISEEEGRFFLVRDDSKISALKQKRSQLVKENNSMVEQYNKM